MSNAAADKQLTLSDWLDELDADPANAEAHFAAFAAAGAPDAEINAAELNRRYNSENLRRAYAAKIQELQGTGQFAPALSRLDVLATLDPQNAEILIVRGMILLAMGRAHEALTAFTAGLDLMPDNPYFRAYFVQALLRSGIEKFDPIVKKWLGRFLREPNSVPVESLEPLWRALLLRDPGNPAVAQGVAFAGDQAAFVQWASTLAPEAAHGLTDDFFLDGLRTFILPDIGFERFLTRLRRFFLECAAPAPWMTYVAAALAQHCFLNEYVFSQTPEEEQRLGTLPVDTPFAAAVYGCYRPLNTLPVKVLRSNALQEPVLSWAVRQQVEEPAQEAQLRKKIRPATVVKDDVSQKVRAQYEENPYPRWVSACPVIAGGNAFTSMPAWLAAKEFLVAGCGTGWQPVMLSLMRPDARITGIDLSFASLAYARRKADELGIRNLNLMQGDILELGSMKERFDLIESMGVLHHMKDPAAGWRVLKGLLRPKGVMRIGLYSRPARRHLIEAQHQVKGLKLPPTPAGIRSCREIFMALPADHPYRGFMTSEDFFSTSMVRDCLFHVQEHDFTLLEIATMLDDLGLEFRGFAPLDSLHRQGYAAMFPKDPAMLDLGHWHEYEQANPDAFIGMYQFWCGPRGG